MVGNIPNFTKIDILRCFLRFQKNTGRQEIAKDMELGEGTVRTVLEILKSKKLLDSTKKGHFLSKKGEDMLNQIYGILSTPKNVAIHHIYPNLKKIGVIVRSASSLKELYKLRDIAVKNGADGALILKFENGLYAPESDYEQSYKELEKGFDFKNGDILVVAFSDSKRNAENGALAIAVELSSFLKKFISEL
ncbi:hypothetical protein HYX05_04650 [Candidatus Woesearchaeota archaeon]|nr:hypothetical protein [Candidatus Woesearchaeota archaeon]